MSLDPSTIVAHDEAFPGNPVVPPIVQTSLFTFGSYRELAWLERIRAMPGWVHPYELMPGHPLPAKAD